MDAYHDKACTSQDVHHEQDRASSNNNREIYFVILPIYLYCKQNLDLRVMALRMGRFKALNRCEFADKCGYCRDRIILVLTSGSKNLNFPNIIT